jgi:hypothetical protein
VGRRFEREATTLLSGYVDLASFAKLGAMTQFPASPQTVAEPFLVGRDSEFDELRRRLDEIEGHGSAMLVAGEAGIGKSTLLAAARAYALERGCRVLAAAGTEAEAELPFAAVHQLLRPILYVPRAGEASRLALRTCLLSHESSYGQRRPHPWEGAASRSGAPRVARCSDSSKATAPLSLRQAARELRRQRAQAPCRDWRVLLVGWRDLPVTRVTG